MEGQVDQYSDQLRLLTIFHYIFGGLTGLLSCIPLIHIVLGIVFLLFPGKMTSDSGDVPPAWLGWIFIVTGTFVMALGWTFAIFAITAGRSLIRRKRHTLCVIVAAISCIFFPLGTILGVFTLVIITKPEVKELFGKS